MSLTMMMRHGHGAGQQEDPSPPISPLQRPRISHSHPHSHTTHPLPSPKSPTQPRPDQSLRRGHPLSPTSSTSCKNEHLFSRQESHDKVLLTWPATSESRFEIATAAGIFLAGADTEEHPEDLTLSTASGTAHPLLSFAPEAKDLPDESCAGSTCSSLASTPTRSLSPSPCSSSAPSWTETDMEASVATTDLPFQDLDCKDVKTPMMVSESLGWPSCRSSVRDNAGHACSQCDHRPCTVSPPPTTHSNTLVRTDMSIERRMPLQQAFKDLSLTTAASNLIPPSLTLSSVASSTPLAEGALFSSMSSLSSSCCNSLSSASLSSLSGDSSHCDIDEVEIQNDFEGLVISGLDSEKLDEEAEKVEPGQEIRGSDNAHEQPVHAGERGIDRKHGSAGKSCRMKEQEQEAQAWDGHSGMDHGSHSGRGTGGKGAEWDAVPIHATPSLQQGHHDHPQEQLDMDDSSSLASSASTPKPAHRTLPNIITSPTPSPLATTPIAASKNTKNIPLPASPQLSRHHHGPDKQPPTARFKIQERLGFGSSGSSVFKALDTFEDDIPVAIKKIPLWVMTDGPGSETTSEDVDYFVSWIVDHCCSDEPHTGDLKYPSMTPTPDSATPAASPTRLAFAFATEGSLEDPDRPDPVDSGVKVRKRLSWSAESSKGLEQIVQCRGCHRDDSELWLSLEYCAGGSVADLIRLSDGPLTEGEIGWMMSQILLGLAYLHSKDHVHGDIKAGNILLTMDGHVKLGGSGSIMNHKEGAGERKRRRRSLTMSEFPASWLAPESSMTAASPNTFSFTSSAASSPKSPHPSVQMMPEASAETDIWALGVACIELSQGRPPRPETPILASFGEPHRRGQDDGSASAMGLSPELWTFIGKCLTPEPEARPTVRELLKDPFIEKHNQLSQELLSRIRRMMDFVDQCAIISSDGLLQDTSLTLSPSRATQLFDLKVEEERIGPWLIPMVRPRVDSVYDESSYFDEAGLPISPPDQRPELDVNRPVSDWKHQRISHPVVKQALMCDRAGYITFRHSRSPSLATIIENQWEEHVLSTTESDEDEPESEEDEAGNDEVEDAEARETLKTASEGYERYGSSVIPVAHKGRETDKIAISSHFNGPQHTLMIPRPRTVSTLSNASTATNSSVSTVTPNKSLERMLWMMMRTDKNKKGDEGSLSLPLTGNGPLVPPFLPTGALATRRRSGREGAASTGQRRNSHEMDQEILDDVEVELLDMTGLNRVAQRDIGEEREGIVDESRKDKKVSEEEPDPVVVKRRRSLVHRIEIGITGLDKSEKKKKKKQEQRWLDTWPLRQEAGEENLKKSISGRSLRSRWPLRRKESRVDWSRVGEDEVEEEEEEEEVEGLRRSTIVVVGDEREGGGTLSASAVAERRGAGGKWRDSGIWRWMREWPKLKEKMAAVGGGGGGREGVGRKDTKKSGVSTNGRAS